MNASFHKNNKKATVEHIGELFDVSLYMDEKWLVTVKAKTERGAIGIAENYVNDPIEKPDQILLNEDAFI